MPIKMREATKEEKQAVNEYIQSISEKVYTKGEVIAMLTEIQLEIEELPTNRMVVTDSSGLICYGYSVHEPTAKDASKVIQQKINLLKENEDGSNNN